jgi:hypothetical protein
MNIISINFAKTAVVAAMLLLAFSVVFVAKAEIVLTSATINGSDSATVATGAEVTIAVAGDKVNLTTPAGCTNNWRATVVSLNGDVVHTENLGSITGTASVSDSFTFTAPGVAGDYEVLVEVMGGGESFGDTTCDDNQVWDTETLSLTVYEPVDPYIEVLSISPLDEERIVGDTNPVTYVAEVEVGGTPDSATLQCVIFDIFQGDGWQTVDVNLGAGVHQVQLDYDISGMAVGDYDVVAIASEETCADATDGDFTTDDYRDNGNTQYDAETVLHIVEDEVPPACRLNEVFGNVWGDDDQNDELGEGESLKTAWEVKISNGETTQTTTTDEEGNYSFCVDYGTWTITQTSPEGWTYSYPDDGEWVITFEAPVLSFLDQVINFFVPTALAAVAPNNGPLNFGVFQLPTYSQASYSNGGGGNGTRVELRDGGGSSDDEDEDDAPEGEVLGESTSVVPVGAPSTGAGGASPLSLDLNILTAILAARGRKEEIA